MEHKPAVGAEEKKTEGCCLDKTATEIPERANNNTVVRNAILAGALILGAAIIASAAIATRDTSKGTSAKTAEHLAALEESVVPSRGIEIPATWGDLGRQMMAAGVIDRAKFESVYAARGGMDPYVSAMLGEQGNGRIRMTRENSGAILNLLWALGLGNKNDILEKGEMTDPRYEGAGQFASTGGWTLAKGAPMDHYSMHRFLDLDTAAQEKVDRVTKNIYRPCCGNSTHFPDCNHGMAMLGLMELMASQGASEDEMYRTALQVNAYWFPEQYMTIAKVLASQGVAWDEADPRQVLGTGYSSAAGYQRVAQAASQLEKPEGDAAPRGPSSGGGCAV